MSPRTMRTTLLHHQRQARTAIPVGSPQRKNLTTRPVMLTGPDYKRPLSAMLHRQFIPTGVAVAHPNTRHQPAGTRHHDHASTPDYRMELGDGTPNLVTTSTGWWSRGMNLNTDPEPRHYPTQGWRSMLDGPYPHEPRHHLTTTWSGTATNFTEANHQRPRHHYRNNQFPSPPGRSNTATPGRKQGTETTLMVVSRELPVKQLVFTP